MIIFFSLHFIIALELIGTQYIPAALMHALVYKSNLVQTRLSLSIIYVSH